MKSKGCEKLCPVSVRVVVGEFEEIFERESEEERGTEREREGERGREREREGKRERDREREREEEREMLHLEAWKNSASSTLVPLCIERGVLQTRL